MKIFRKIRFGILAAAAIIFIAGCETTPEKVWAGGQDGYNKIAEQIFQLRAPCVADLPIEKGGFLNAGPDHPRCYIDDAAMVKIAVVMKTADAVLREMEAASLAGGGPDYDRLLVRLDGLLLQVIAAIAEARRDAGG